MKKDYLHGLFIMLVTALVLAFVFLSGGMIGYTAANYQFDECLDAMGEIGIDANDTEARSNFLKTCYEAK